MDDYQYEESQRIASELQNEDIPSSVLALAKYSSYGEHFLNSIAKLFHAREVSENKAITGMKQWDELTDEEEVPYIKEAVNWADYFEACSGMSIDSALKCLDNGEPGLCDSFAKFMVEEKGYPEEQVSDFISTMSVYRFDALMCYDEKSLLKLSEDSKALISSDIDRLFELGKERQSIKVRFSADMSNNAKKNSALDMYKHFLGLKNRGKHKGNVPS